MQRRAVDRSALEAAQAAQREAEGRAAALERERGSVAAEVEDMQKALARLQLEAGAETQARVRGGGPPAWVWGSTERGWGPRATAASWPVACTCHSLLP